MDDLAPTVADGVAPQSKDQNVLLPVPRGDQLALRCVRDPFEYYGRLRRVREHVLANIDKKISRHTAARIACFSLGYFSTYFRSKVGHTFAEWLSWTRVTKAAALLTQEDLSLTAVAEKVGFGTVRTLERHFKDTLGLTPREFKSRYMHDILSRNAAGVSHTSAMHVWQTPRHDT